MIWLIDYTTYEIEIDPLLAEYKRDYFRVKAYKRKNIIGETAPVKTMTYANGILRIATLLAQNGVACRYVHAKDFIKMLDEGCDLPEIIAFSTVCPTVPLAEKLAVKIKKLSPKTKVYVGGPEVNSAPKLVRKNFPAFDKLIVGHEVYAASEIASKSIIPKEEYIDFDLLPYPLKDYAINTFTVLGCPFSCGYCTDGRAPHIEVSVDALLSNMKGLRDKTLVHVFDSVFGYSTARALNISKNLQKLNHNYILSCDMRAELLTPELIREMYKAGFREIRLGIESADEELLKANGRTLAPGKCIEAIKMIRDNSPMYITLYSVTGLPGTTVESHGRTIEMFDRLLRDGLCDEIKNSLYVPYPYDDLDYKTQGVTILDNDWSHYDRQSYPVFETELTDRKTIWQLYLKTAKSIAESWLKSVGFSSFEDIPDLSNYYGEYIQTNYMLNGEDEDE